MVTKPSTEQTQDFSIHNEDFPALPGPNYKDAALNNDESKTVSGSPPHPHPHPRPYPGCASSRMFRKRPLPSFFVELELHKQEHVQRRRAQVPRRQNCLSTEQQPEEGDPGVA